jgi:hypothetical protein
MTTEQLAELQASVARLHELAEFFAPVYAKEDVAACWADICAQIGAADEQQRRIAVQEGQASLFDVEGWPCR